MPHCTSSLHNCQLQGMNIKYIYVNQTEACASHFVIDFKFTLRRMFAPVVSITMWLR
jgi:hypothetical protein